MPNKMSDMPRKIYNNTNYNSYMLIKISYLRRHNIRISTLFHKVSKLLYKISKMTNKIS